MNIAAGGPPAARGTADTASADTPSEFAQLIQSLTPQPVDAKAAPRTGNVPAQPVSPGTARKSGDTATAPAVNRGTAPKIANIAPQPVSPAGVRKSGDTAAAPPVNEAAVRKTENTAPVERTAKIATAVASPQGVETADQGGTRLVAASPGQFVPAGDVPDVSRGDAVLGTKRDVSTRNSADVSSTGEVNTALPPPKQESAEAAAPVESQPMRKTAAPAKSNEIPVPPAIAIATPVLPLPLPPVSTRTPASNAPSPQPVEAPPQESSSSPVLTAAPALEVRIRATEQPKDDSVPVTQAQAAPQQQPQAEIPVPGKTVSSPIPAAAPPPLQPQVQPQSNPVAAAVQSQAAPVLAPAASRMDRPASQPAQYYEAAAEPPSPSRSQPLRSVSLEFTPDGAADVRLRLSERAGDVHIELHSTDAALTGRLSEGVHDLAASLVNAGYDAQAWTPGQDREGGRGKQQEDPSGRERAPAADPDAEDFETAMQEPMKEFS